MMDNLNQLHLIKTSVHQYVVYANEPDSGAIVGNCFVLPTAVPVVYWKYKFSISIENSQLGYGGVLLRWENLLWIIMIFLWFKHILWILFRIFMPSRHHAGNPAKSGGWNIDQAVQDVCDEKKKMKWCILTLYFFK